MSHPRYILKDLQNHAKNRGGKCHSTVYKRNDTKYDWECKEGHRFFAAWSNVNRKRKPQWCRDCYVDSLRHPFSKIQKKITDLGGKLITKEKNYINSSSELRYICDKGHEVVSDWSRLQQSSINKNTGIRQRWCRDCAGKIRWTIPKLQKEAKKRGGILISNEYINQNQKLIWRCFNNHEFKLDIHHIISGDQWCPDCMLTQHPSEKITRLFFEHIFNSKFNKEYPNWLTNTSDRKLELDGYNKKLKISFEYQGVQHYEYIPYFHKNGIDDLYKQQSHDNIKRRECKKRGIHLIEVSYKLKRDDLFDFIIDECKKRNIKIKNDKKINWRTFDLSNEPLKDEMDKIAKERGGICLSEFYIDSKTPLMWECSFGHRWMKSPSGIKQHWCLKCSGKERVSMNVIKEYVEKRGGVFNTDDNVYKNRNSILKISCAFGHSWNPTWSSLNGHWCSECSGNKKGTIEEFKRIAKERGGECLSNEYINSSTHLRFKCKEGHIWNASPSNVKNKCSWCQKCYNIRRKKSN